MLSLGNGTFWKITLKRKCLGCHSWLFSPPHTIGLNATPNRPIYIRWVWNSFSPDTPRPDENPTALGFLLKVIIQRGTVFSSNFFMMITLIIDFESLSRKAAWSGRLGGFGSRHGAHLSLERKHIFVFKMAQTLGLVVLWYCQLTVYIGQRRVCQCWDC